MCMCTKGAVVCMCAFVSMATGNMSSRKHVCRCMFACTKGEVFKGSYRAGSALIVLHATLCLAKFIQF